jgi:hypothetical protein
LIGALPIFAYLRPFGRCLVLLTLLTGGAFALASCKEKLPPCPLVKVRTPLNQITKFAPGEPGAKENVVYASRIRGVAVKCSYDEIEARKSTRNGESSDEMEVLLKINFETLRGAAATGGEVPGEYFVAVADRQETILNRVVFPIKLPLPAGSGTAVSVEEVWMRFELEGRNGLAFLIFVGFTLTDEEVEFNQRLLQSP